MHLKTHPLVARLRLEAGSTGIFRCHYQGEWPKGSWWVHDEGDLWPSRPILFRLDPEKEAEQKARLKAAAERFAKEIENDNPA